MKVAAANTLSMVVVPINSLWLVPLPVESAHVTRRYLDVVLTASAKPKDLT